MGQAAYAQNCYDTIVSNVRIITPPEITEVTTAILFLNGPIQGAPDWQADAVDAIRSQPPDHELTIASPRKAYLDGTFIYEKQVDWETHYRSRCHKIGVNLFWLAAQTTDTPGRSYAQTTRVELGETMTEHIYTGAKMVVGIEQGFSNARYIRRRLAQSCPGVLVVDSLDDTCTEAVRLLGEVGTR
jgi:hypothetical protein